MYKFLSLWNSDVFWQVFFVEKNLRKTNKLTNEEKSSIVISVMSRHRGKVSVVSSLTTTMEEEETTTTNNTETKVQLVFDDEGPGEGNRKSRNVRRRRRNNTNHTSLTNSMMKTMKMMTKMMRKKTRGYLAVFLVSAIWVCASFIVKDLEMI